MEAGLIIGNQIIIMFIILIIGAFCYLKGIITKDGTKQLSSFALNIINPVLIFMSYQSKYDKSLVHGLLWSFLLSAISYAVTILLTYVLIRKKTPDLAVERVSSIYSNCACGEEADQQMVGRTIGKGPCHGIEVVYKHITTRT